MEQNGPGTRSYFNHGSTYWAVPLSEASLAPLSVRFCVFKAQTGIKTNVIVQRGRFESGGAVYLKNIWPI